MSAARRQAAAAPRAARAVAPRLARPALVAVAVISLGVFHVWARTRVVAAGYELGALQREHVRLTSEHDRLRIEVETLRSPAALERFARTRLGMAPPAPGAVRAAGPRLALAGGGVGEDVDGMDRPGPAEPARSRSTAPARPPSAVRVALRGPLVAGRAPPAR
ncbi:MAG TPA: cell division protein FtsL [Anaeromyxobacter sp.]|nr:cell division protein FtsL [Anaeromyxobacter sp.]